MRYGGGIGYLCRRDGTLVMPSYSFSIVWYGSPFLKRQMMVHIWRCCPESFGTFGVGPVSSTRRNLLRYGIGRSSCVIPSSAGTGKCPYCFPGCCHRAVSRNTSDGSICIQEPHNRCYPIVGHVLNLSRRT